MFITYNENATVTVHATCPFCGKPHSVTVDEDGAEKYFDEGMLVQRAFPTMDASTREFLITGMCPECQDEFF